MKSALDVLLPDELLVRVSTFLDLPAVLALRAASRCLSSLTPFMLQHDPTTRALMAIVVGGTAASGDAIIRASKHDSRQLARQVVHRLVCRPHRNRRFSLKLMALPTIIRDFVHHRDYGLDADGFVELLHGIFQLSPPMALHLLGLVGLAGPGWVMGVTSDNGSANGYALEMYAAMLNFGVLEDRRLEGMRADIAKRFLDLAAPPSDFDWIRNAAHFAQTSDGLADDGSEPDRDDYLPMSVLVDPYELVVVPLGGLAWVMSQIRSTNPIIVSFGAKLLIRINIGILDDNTVLNHPGAASGLVEALSSAAALEGTDIWHLWCTTERYLGTRPSLIHDVLVSDLVKNIATRCKQPSPDYDWTGAPAAVRGLYKFAIQENASPDVVCEIADVAIAICQHPLTNLFKRLDLIDQLLNLPVETVVHSLIEKAYTFSRLLMLPNTLADRNTSRNLVHQCGRAIASLGGWGRILAIISTADDEELPNLFHNVVQVCFGEPEILAALEAPPTRQWCARLISHCTVKPVVTYDRMVQVVAILAQLGDQLVEYAANIDTLHGATPNQILLAKSNLRLVMAMIDFIDPNLAGIKPTAPLVPIWHRVMEAVMSTCLWYRTSPGSHSGVLCEECRERLSKLWE
ncbi:hypothetical protein BC828DRAFT_228174 [Blastocladiella britannica]|nr:hypothetical protein BC828DRAFT_228174 [Blastocladiella britannica]